MGYEPLLKMPETKGQTFEAYEIDNVLRQVGCRPGRSMKMELDKKIYYQNIVLTMDIKTSNFIENGEEKSTMYHWQLCIHGLVVMGREWQDLIKVINRISEYYKCDYANRVVIYIQNESFEFQFMHMHFDWEKVFALSAREPVRALTTNGIEFRCSFSLSALPRENILSLVDGTTMTVITDKNDGKVRNTRTEITEEEYAEYINEVTVLAEYINHKMIEDKGIAHIKETATRYVRDELRNRTRNARNKKDRAKYNALMADLTLTTDEYVMARKCFAGGFAHYASAFKDKVVENVKSKDFTSKYPYVMLAEGFPMSKGRKVEIKSMAQLEELAKTSCMMFDVMFKNLQKRDNVGDCYLATDKCAAKENYDEHDGYIVFAGRIATSMTNVDLEAMKYCYTWDSIAVKNCYVYKKAYLPKAIIEYILELYADKTNLKGVENKTAEYLRKKGLLNSIYGMMVMNIVHDQVEYLRISEIAALYKVGEMPWNTIEADVEKAIMDYNQSQRRFTFYPWGVFVTAYARRDLWVAIASLGSDYKYSDTDCVKYTGEHRKFFEQYNNIIKKKLQKMAEYYKIEEDRLHPNGKWIGVWEDDGDYDYFKAIGTKQYITSKDKEMKLTLAGLSKKAMGYIVETYGNGRKDTDDAGVVHYIAEEPMKVMDAFESGLTIPAEHSGIKMVEYNDKPTSGAVTDYQGNTWWYDEKSNIYTKPVSFKINTDNRYVNAAEAQFRKERKYYE